MTQISTGVLGTGREFYGPDRGMSRYEDDTDGALTIETSSAFTLSTTGFTAGQARAKTYGGDPMIQVVVELLEDVTITTEDNGTLGGWGSLHLGSLPAGFYVFQGGQIRSAGITGDGTGVASGALINASIGTTAVDGNLATPASSGALQTTDANVVGNATLTLSSDTNANEFGGQLLATTSASSGEVDLSSTSDIYVNHGIDATDSTAAGTLTYTAGTKFIFWCVRIGGVAASD
jgi:hypothetical protein